MQDVQSLRDRNPQRPQSAKPEPPSVEKSAKNLEPITEEVPAEADNAKAVAPQQPPPVERKDGKEEEDPEPIIEEVGQSSGQKSMKKSSDPALQSSGPMMSNQDVQESFKQPSEKAPDASLKIEAKEENVEDEVQQKSLTQSKGMKDLARMDPDGVVMGNFDDDDQARPQQDDPDDYDEQQMAEEEEQYRMMVEADLAEHGIQSFFEVPYEYQEVIFMMVKGDNEGLQASKLYNEQPDLFNYYLELVIRFNQDFDPTETLMAIAKDGERIESILNAPDELVPLRYILEDLWPRIGFLPIDPENPGLVLIAEFMLNELILKYSESLDKLNLVHLKELFSGDDGEDGDEYEDDAEELEKYGEEAAMAQMGQLKR